MLEFPNNRYTKSLLPWLPVKFMTLPGIRLHSISVGEEFECSKGVFTVVKPGNCYVQVKGVVTGQERALPSWTRVEPHAVV